MKKKVLIILGIVIVVAIIAVVIVCVVNKGKGNKMNAELIKTINDNSNLPIEYMSKYNSEDNEINGFERLKNFMSVDYSNEDIAFSYYGYPNDESDFYLGRVSLKTDKYNILGIKIGDDMKEAVSKVESYGFELKEHNDYFSATLKKDDYTIKIESEIENDDETKDTVGSISISVNSKYLGNRVY